MYSTAFHIRFKLSTLSLFLFLFIMLRSNHDTLLPHAGTTAHTLELAGKLGVVLLDLDLCPRGFGIRKSVDEFAFGAGELGGALEELEGLDDLALLEEELGHGGDGDIALGVDWKRFVSA